MPASTPASASASARRLGLLAILCLLTVPIAVHAIGLPIQIDGDYSDWGTGAEVGTDPSGDDGSSGIDFTSLQIADDDDWVYFRLDTTVEVQGDEGQDLVFALDTDENPSTGYSVGGIGAELVWRLGDRSGSIYPSGTSIDHPSLGLVLAPTVSDVQFEFALSRSATPNGTALFPGSGFDVYFWDDAGGDAIGPYGYGFSGTSQSIDSRPLGRELATHVRIASYNIENDGLFDGGATGAAFDRLFDAIDPDVWVLCEVWSYDAAETAARVEELLPSSGGEVWNAVKRDPGNVIASRFPILDSWDVLPGARITAALLDLGPEAQSDLLVIANHWSCCTADDNRQEQADALIAFLRDARTSGGLLDLPADTPIIAAGDFNLVGLRPQLVTLETGDIFDQGTFGPDSPPDWDGSDFDRAEIRHSDARFVYTWRNDGSSFYPGQLDFVWYTGSVVGLHRNLTVETRTMSPATLTTHGLFGGDTERASDHAPIFADFSIGDTSGTGEGPGDVSSGPSRLLGARPSPFRIATDLRFQLEDRASVDVVIYDVGGRIVRHLAEDRLLGPGEVLVSWNGRDDEGRALPSGVYGYVIRTGGETMGGSVVRLQ